MAFTGAIVVYPLNHKDKLTLEPRRLSSREHHCADEVHLGTKVPGKKWISRAFDVGKTYFACG